MIVVVKFLRGGGVSILWTIKFWIRLMGRKALTEFIWLWGENRVKWAGYWFHSIGNFKWKISQSVIFSTIALFALFTRT